MPKKRKVDPREFSATQRTRFKKEQVVNPPVSVLSSSDSESESNGESQRPSGGLETASCRPGKQGSLGSLVQLKDDQIATTSGTGTPPPQVHGEKMRPGNKDPSVELLSSCEGDAEGAGEQHSPDNQEEIVHQTSAPTRETLMSRNVAPEYAINQGGSPEDFGDNREGSPERSEEDDPDDGEDGSDPTDTDATQSDATEAADDDEWEDSEEDVEQDGRRRPPGGAFNFDNEPLYPNAPLTVGQSLVATLLFVLVHSLAGAAIKDLLSLIFIHCIKPTRFTNTLYKFKKYFADLSAPLTYQYFCGTCSTLLESKTVCPNCNSENIKYFMRLSIESQLQNLFARPGFYGLLQRRFTRPKRSAGNFEDVYDGNMYRSHEQFTGNPNNLTFTLYTDGVSIYKSAKYNIWPLLLCIQQLPFKERIKKENMVVAGLWFGKDKPDANVFLLPFHEEFARLYQGVSLKVHNIVQRIVVRCLCLCCTMDMDARACFCQLNKWSGYFACLKCTVKGEKSQRTSNVMVFPYEEHAILRTAESFLKSAADALTAKCAVLGVHGPTALAALFPQKDLVSYMTIDSMHCLFQGLSKKLPSLWFSPEFRDCPFSLTGLAGLIGVRLEKILPLSFVQRLPRSIEEHLSYWKATEVRNWFFYYSAPLLHDIMLPKYFEHYLMLVYGVYLLNTDSISPADVELSKILLTSFVKNFECLYGVRHMSLNLHSLLHLPNVVEAFGPLWASNCFPFESILGEFVKMIHGTRYAEVQLVSVLSLHMNLPVLVSEMLPGDVREFCQKLLKRGHVKKTILVGEDTYAVGKLQLLTHVPDEIQRALATSDVAYNKLWQFRKLLKKGELYFSKSYVRSIRTDSTCVSYTAEGQTNLGVVASFVCVTLCECPELCKCIQGMPYAVIQRLDNATCFSISDHNTTVPVPVSFIQDCTLTDDVEVVPTDQLLGLRFAVKVEERFFLVKPPNMMERE